MSIRGLFTSSRRQRIGSFVLAVALAALSLPKAWAADNPYNLIDPKTISVGTMGDAKPYAFTTADGKFTG
ncbi:MAG: amino acid ABC transporter substrate-binding protein, partial [Mesorhizobium sp.]